MPDKLPSRGVITRSRRDWLAQRCAASGGQVVTPSSAANSAVDLTNNANDGSYLAVYAIVAFTNAVNPIVKYAVNKLSALSSAGAPNMTDPLAPVIFGVMTAGTRSNNNALFQGCFRGDGTPYSLGDGPVALVPPGFVLEVWSDALGASLTVSFVWTLW